MPNISNIKKKPKTPTKSKKTKKPTNLPVRTKAPKSSPVDYYNCLLSSAQQGWHDPATGQKQKITACCKKCKANAPALASQRTNEINKLITSYRQVGDSLTKLLQPINNDRQN